LASNKQYGNGAYGPENHKNPNTRRKGTGKKLSELATFESELAESELELATLRAELQALERQYLRVVGVRFAELDEIEAKIAEALADQSPGDTSAHDRAASARSRAQESAQAAGTVREPSERERFEPSEDLKKLYRDVAKRIHPDLATDENERERRTHLMAEANKAYEEGDEERLKAILREWGSSPEAVPGDSVGARLVRTIRKIAQVEERLRAIKTEIASIKESDLYDLKTKVEEALKDGRDLLAEMAYQIEQQIKDARKRLKEIGL